MLLFWIEVCSAGGVCEGVAKVLRSVCEAEMVQNVHFWAIQAVYSGFGGHSEVVRSVSEHTMSL